MKTKEPLRVTTEQFSKLSTAVLEQLPKIAEAKAKQITVNAD